MDAVVKEGENMIEPKREVEDTVELKEAKVELIDEMDDNEYQHIIPYEYRDYKDQHTEKERPPWRSMRAPPEKRRNIPVQCQKCYKFIAVDSFSHALNHAVSHTNLKRYKCDKCDYGSWNRYWTQKHINSHYEKEPCSMQEVQLSEEDHLKLRHLTRECFPGVAEVSQRMPIIEEKTTKGVRERCQKCKKFVIVDCFSTAVGHAVNHMSSSRRLSFFNTFTCDLCDYGSWNRSIVQKHINLQHKNESCSIKELQLSEEEQLELTKLADECFPGLAERRNYIEQHTERAPKAARKQCQKCKKMVIMDCLSSAVGHAVSHTNLSRGLSYFNTFKYELCDYGSWSRSIVQQHVNRQHENVSCSVKVVKLSEEEQLELNKLIEKCFPKGIKVKPIDEMDVKKEEIDDDEYKHIIPYKYRDYMEQNIEEERPKWHPQKRKRRLSYQCQKCNRFFALRSIVDAQKHAVTHTNLKRFKCEQCDYGSWNRINLQRHINRQHKNVSCSVKEVQLSEEDQLELRNITEECFPGMDVGKRFNNDDTPFEEEPTNEESRKEQCQQCNKFVVLSCYSYAISHAVTHTNLKRFKCEKCNYGSWYRSNVQSHINSQHKNESCSVEDIQLSKEEELELDRTAEECFPEVIEELKRRSTGNEKSVEVEEEHSTINRKRPYQL